jgi:hypothetical protein
MFAVQHMEITVIPDRGDLGVYRVICRVKNHGQTDYERSGIDKAQPEVNSNRTSSTKIYSQEVIRSAKKSTCVTRRASEETNVVAMSDVLCG